MNEYEMLLSDRKRLWGRAIRFTIFATAAIAVLLSGMALFLVH